jgi:hypothetical protein
VEPTEPERPVTDARLTRRSVGWANCL